MSIFEQTPDDYSTTLGDVKLRPRAGAFMSNAERKLYAAFLESKEAELAASLGNRDGIVIEKAADPLDEIQSAGERELTIRGLHRESSLLRSVRNALTRMASGVYGACLHCEVEINAKRLAAVPWARYCIRCQEAADRQEFETTEEVDGLLVDAAWMSSQSMPAPNNLR